MVVQTPRDVARRNLTVLAAASFCAGIFLMVAIIYFIKGELIAWMDVGGVIFMAGTAAIIGRRTLRKISERL